MITPEIIIETSRKLRKYMTESEIILWSFIKGGKIGARFLRQKPIYVFTELSGLGRYNTGFLLSGKQINIRNGLKYSWYKRSLGIGFL